MPYIRVKIQTLMYTRYYIRFNTSFHSKFKARIAGVGYLRMLTLLFFSYVGRVFLLQLHTRHKIGAVHKGHRHISPHISPLTPSCLQGSTFQGPLSKKDVCKSGIRPPCGLISKMCSFVSSTWKKYVNEKSIQWNTLMEKKW